VRSYGEPVRLSTTEFDLLTYLMTHAGHVLTREQILRAVWGYDHDPGTNVVDVYIGYLRRKLGRGAVAPGGPGPRDTGERTRGPIVTVRSVGYRFEPAA
jgi:DNA-binding response OmpR family regulator